MLKQIKSYMEYGENCGIAWQVQGQVVDAKPHPIHPNMWQFEYGGYTWIASDYAFKENTGE